MEATEKTTTPTRQVLVDEIISKLMRHETHLSFSSLKCFGENPKAFIDYKLKTITPTPAMVYGSMMHCLVLQPELFEQRYFVLDDAEIVADIGGAKPRATNKYKDWKNEQEALAGEKIIVSAEDYLQASMQNIAIKTNRSSNKILKQTKEAEKEIEWEYKNFIFNGVIDRIGDVVLDLKSCADAEPRKFQREIINRQYHLQAAMYLKGIAEVKPYYIIAIDADCNISVHELSESLINYGLEEYDRLLERFNECILNDELNSSYDFWAERFDGVYVADKPEYLY